MNRSFLGGRLLQIVIVLFGVSLITFALTYLSSGDPAVSSFTSQGISPTRTQVAERRRDMGLDRPFAEQYGKWLAGICRGDFGTSYSRNEPVTAVLLSRLMPTLGLTLLALVFMLAIAIPEGTYAAVHEHGWPDHLLRGITFLGISIPNFWFGMILMFVLGLKLHLLPILSSSAGFSSMIMPALTLAFAMSAKYARQVRTAVLEELGQDYIVGARARGLSERQILWRHVLPNAMLPLVTMLGLSLGSLLGGTAVVEVLFAYPGLGNLAVEAIENYDYPLVQGYVLWIALIYMVINFVVDMTYHRLDPRVRLRG
ncbi:nickel ABC transporter permease [Pseudoramibacter alactolyticus]|uniref:nickel ABC transporter permease n=1 Tax=Pseudoramibacter alactolyticus TaxID=113287 RepID=UPI002357CB2D|nr:nickel ABC transporter permease [Pseudoramibacter alactolyticus]MBM6968465.1 ABC transporter permease [Pseudoramibacter alactolyticus]